MLEKECVKFGKAPQGPEMCSQSGDVTVNQVRVT